VARRAGAGRDPRADGRRHLAPLAVHDARLQHGSVPGRAPQSRVLPRAVQRLRLCCGPHLLHEDHLDLEAQLDLLSLAADLNARRGYRFRSIDAASWDQDLKHVYELCRHSFATYWSVSESTFEEFSNIYDRWLRRVGADNIVLALDPSSAVVGLGLSVLGPADTLNIRTIAVLPHVSGFGLGQAIVAEHYRRAIAAGRTRVQHCLMGPTTPPQFWDRGLGQVTR
jgi:GNAT superfamily N-acetyltransferase